MIPGVPVDEFTLDFDDEKTDPGGNDAAHYNVDWCACLMCVKSRLRAAARAVIKARPKCECGSAALGWKLHSPYCPLA